MSMSKDTADAELPALHESPLLPFTASPRHAVVPKMLYKKTCGFVNAEIQGLVMKK